MSKTDPPRNGDDRLRWVSSFL